MCKKEKLQNLFAMPTRYVGFSKFEASILANKSAAESYDAFWKMMWGTAE